MPNTPRKYVQGQNYFLYGSGISFTATTIKLKKFQLPNSFVPITMSMFGTVGYATLDPEIPTREENISFTGVIQYPDESAELTGVTRGLKLDHDYTQDLSLRQAHIGGSILRITNPVQLYNDLGNKENDESINGAWDFPASTAAGRPRNRGVSTPLLADELITKQDALNILSSVIIVPGVTFVSSATTGLLQALSLTWNHTVSGTNRFLTVAISTQEDEIINGVTFNGVPLTQSAFKTNVAGNIRTEIWTLIAPALGTHQIIVTMSNPSYITGGGISYDNVNQATPIDAVGAGNSGNSTSPTDAIVTNFDNSIIQDILGTAIDPSTYAATAPQSIQWSITSAATRQGGSSIQLGALAGAFNNAYTLGVVEQWSIITLAIRGIANTLPVSGQAAIQFEDETGAPLGAAGTVDEFEITGPSVTAVRVGNKVTYTVSSSGGGGTYAVDQTPDNGTYGLLGGAVDGINTTFTVSAGVYLTGTLVVYLNGLAQLQGAADDWQETVPAAGTFDFNTAPLVGDIITVVYQISGGTSAQTGILWEDQGVALGSVATVDEVDFVGAGVIASRVGNKVTVTIPGGLSSIEKKVGVGATNDIAWHNFQIPFIVNTAAGGDNMWSYNGGIKSGSYLNLGNTEDFSLSTDMAGLFPWFDGASGGQFLSFRDGKQAIFQVPIVSFDANLGGIGFSSAGAPMFSAQGTNLVGVGFVSNAAGQWFARTANGVGFTETPIVIASTTKYVLRCEYDPANGVPQARFYVDGVLVATITTTLPTASGAAIRFSGGGGGVLTPISIVGVPSFSSEI